MKNLIITLTSVLILNGCTSQPQINPETLKYSSVTAEKGFNSEANNTYTINVSDKKGASFLAQINILDSKFNTKATTGTAPKTANDVSKIDVYLLELASIPTAGSDPLGVANANVRASQLGIVKKAGTSSFNLLFQGLPANTIGSSYYVGVVLKDAGNIAIAKLPTTPWTGNTFTTTPSFAVTSSGVSVNTALVVSTATDLTLSVGLLDDTKASVDGDVTILNGLTGIAPVTAN